VTILLGHEQGIVSLHEPPTDVRVTSVVRLAIADGECLHYLTPAVVGQEDGLKRLAASRKEDAVVTDFAGRGHPLTQGQLSPQHFQRTRAEIDLAILVGLGPILFSRQDQSFRDVDRAVNQVAITDLQRKLLRLSQAGEEPELFVVPIPFAVNAMRSGNDRFSIRHGERVYCRAIFLGDSKRREREGRIKLSRKILVPELECCPYRADNVVVSLLLARVGRSYRGQLRIHHFLKCSLSDFRRPQCTQNFAIALKRGIG
jgi:hypothetical protein